MRLIPPTGPPPAPEPPPSRLSVWREKLDRFWARAHNLLLVGLGLLIALAAMFAYDMTRPVPPQITQDDIDAAVANALASATPEPSYESQVYATIEPSLVRVEGTLTQTATENDLSVGTGVVVDQSGDILTSLHVVTNATSIHVIFSDGSASDAKITVRETDNDLAILRPSAIPDDLQPATLGSSDSLQVGDHVVAIGNPFGIENSLTSGVVSGLGRNYRSPKTGQTLTNLIQFDAAVNPGNSGGPLLDQNGDVVGIVTALLNPTNEEVFIGIGFAVPIETATSGLGAPPD